MRSYCTHKIEIDECQLHKTTVIIIKKSHKFYQQLKQSVFFIKCVIAQTLGHGMRVCMCMKILFFSIAMCLPLIDF